MRYWQAVFGICLINGAAILQVYNKIAMQKPRRQITHREYPLRNPQMSVKIPAKKPINLPRNALAGQQSAHRPTRLPRPLISSQHCSTALQESIRSSGIYRMLQQQMQAMANRHQLQQLRLRDLKEAKQQQLARMKREQFATKMQIWQLKNQVLELKESIREERQEEARLQEQLGEASEEGPLEGNNH